MHAQSNLFPQLRLCYAPAFRFCIMRYADLAVIFVYLIGITWFGARFKESQKSLKDYFLGGRTTPGRPVR